MNLLFLYHAGVLALLLALAAMARRNHQDYRVPREVSAEEWVHDAPFVSILAPVRNEERNIEPFLAGLLRQSYPRFEVVVLDDGSTDATAERVRAIAAEDARVRLLAGTSLPNGWAGKTHACYQAAFQARGDWLLFLDADTRAEPGLLSAALREVLDTQADFLSGFPRQLCRTVGEAVTVPFIYWVLFMLLPLRRVWNHPSPAFAAACGQMLLVRRGAYESAGGHAAIPHSLHDGLHLARLFKQHRLRVRLADLSPFLSCRMYEGWTACWRGFTRNAYQAIGSVGALAAVMALEAALFLAPFAWLAIAAGWQWPAWGWLVLAQVGVLLSVQVGLRRRFRFPWLTVVLHPAGITALLAIQGFSAWRHFSGKPAIWRGRAVAGSGLPAERAGTAALE
jgi:hypothetical protein